MYLLMNLDVQYDSYLISRMKRWLNSDEIDCVCSPPTQLSRAKAFIDLITRKRTTELFINFLIALGDSPHVREEIYQAYELECKASSHK